MTLRHCLSAIAAAGLLLSSAGHAQDYQIQLYADYARVDPDNAFQDDIDAFAVGGSYYLQRVRTRGYPLAEAAFLDRASRISAGYGWTDYGDEEEDSVFLGGAAFVDELYFSGSVTHRDNGDSETDGSVAIGYLPADGVLLTAGYSDAGDDSFALNAKAVRLLGQGQALNLQAGVTIADDWNDYSVGGDYYVDPTLSVGGNIAWFDPDRGDSGTDLTIRAQKFFTPVVSGRAFYTVGEHYDAVGIGGSIRF